MTSACRNCESAIQPDHRYCPACGQHIGEAGDRSLGHLLRASIAEVGSLDSRLWRSLRLLMLKPGFLTREYRLGRRHRYLSPISVFLLGNLLFFLAPPVSDFQLTLAEQYEWQPYSKWIAPIIDARVAASGESFESLADRYQNRVVEFAKLMVIVHVPLLALVTMLATADRRLYYADHVVMCLHYFAFLMIFLILLAALTLALLVPLDFDWPGWLPSPAQLVFLLHLLYVPPMLRTALGLPWWRAMLTTLVFVIGLLLAHFAYRLIQFFVSFAAVAG